jgi:hypothetical protein
MQTFIKINNVRLIKSSIKKYAPHGENKINIYFNTSRYRIEMETFVFPTEEERGNVMDYLDAMFL